MFRNFIMEMTPPSCGSKRTIGDWEDKEVSGGRHLWSPPFVVWERELKRRREKAWKQLRDSMRQQSWNPNFLLFNQKGRNRKEQLSWWPFPYANLIPSPPCCQFQHLQQTAWLRPAKPVVAQRYQGACTCMSVHVCVCTRTGVLLSSSLQAASGEGRRNG